LVSAHYFKDNLMGVIDLPLGQIIPYARNPRRNEKAIATVAASIAEFGWRQPIVVDEAMVVLKSLGDRREWPANAVLCVQVTWGSRSNT